MRKSHSAGHGCLVLVCVPRSHCVWPCCLSLSDLLLVTTEVQLVPCRNLKCTECGTTTFGRNRMYTINAHFPTSVPKPKLKFGRPLDSIPNTCIIQILFVLYFCTLNVEVLCTNKYVFILITLSCYDVQSE